MLQSTLERHGGVLRTKGELYRAAREMVNDGLGDPYSEFLEPPAFRAAIRRPSKVELEYLAAQAVGVLCFLPPLPLPPRSGSHRLARSSSLPSISMQR